MHERQHAIVGKAMRQAARDSAWCQDDDVWDEGAPFMLSRKQLKRDAWHKAAAYAREARRSYAMSYLRAYKRTCAERARHMS